MHTEPIGLVLKVLVYIGQIDDIDGNGHVDKVILNLLKEKLNNGHLISMDNFYYSFTLAMTLLELNTYCTATLWLDRKNNPQSVVKEKLKKGETICRYSDRGGIRKRKDKRDVSYISKELIWLGLVARIK